MNIFRAFDRWITHNMDIHAKYLVERALASAEHDEHDDRPAETPRDSFGETLPEASQGHVAPVPHDAPVKAEAHDVSARRH